MLARTLAIIDIIYNDVYSRLFARQRVRVNRVNDREAIPVAKPQRGDVRAKRKRVAASCAVTLIDSLGTLAQLEGRFSLRKNAGGRTYRNDTSFLAPKRARGNVPTLRESFRVHILSE